MFIFSKFLLKGSQFDTLFFRTFFIRIKTFLLAWWIWIFFEDFAVEMDVISNVFCAIFFRFISLNTAISIFSFFARKFIFSVVLWTFQVSNYIIHFLCFCCCRLISSLHPRLNLGFLLFIVFISDGLLVASTIDLEDQLICDQNFLPLVFNDPTPHCKAACLYF